MTSECIDSIFEKTSGIGIEVILVDNASTDGSKELFEKDLRITYIYSNENLGFGKANNLGYKYAHGKYIFLLNSDTLLVNNAIKLLSDFLDSHDDVAIVGGQLFDKDMDPVHSYSYFLPSITWEIDVFLNKALSKCVGKKNCKILDSHGYFPVAYITGADMMLRRKDIDEFGMFNPEFFMYFEETDLSKRFLQHNRISAFCPAAKIVHLEGASFNIKEKKETLYLQSRTLFYSKYYNNAYRTIANVIYFFTCASRIMLFSMNKDKREYWKKKMVIFRDNLLKK